MTIIIEIYDLMASLDIYIVLYILMDPDGFVPNCQHKLMLCGLKLNLFNGFWATKSAALTIIKHERDLFV